MTTTVKHRFLSEHLRTLESEAVERGLEKGLEKGRSEGEAKALLAVLETRGFDVPAQVREQIMGTTDTELLDTWLRAAVTATSLGDLTWARGS